jgi:diguanylate cyclase (GGDEF)-like protein
MPPPTKRAKRWAQAGALPLLLAVSGVLLVCGGFAAPLVWPWLVLIAAGLFAIARWGIAPQTPARHSVEGALLAALATLALTQATGGLWSPLYPLVYLLAAGYMLALPLRLSVPMVAALIALDGALFAPVLKTQWPLFLAHASFAALFAALYHALLGARLALARRAESTAVQRRVADAEECARELRLVATADAETDPGGRQLLGGVAEVEEVLRGALSVAEAALRPHAVAVFLLAPDGESVRLRECALPGARGAEAGAALFRGPLSAREGALGAVLSSAMSVRLDDAKDSLSYYEGKAPAPAFCGVPLTERGGALLGALVADREEPFSEGDQRVLEALSAEVTRSIEAERLLGAVRREKEEKARFFRALEDLNRTTTVLQAAESAVAQARRMCPALDLCAVTLAEDRRHRIVAVEGGASGALRDLSFGDNAGLVSSVVKLGAPLPGRALGAMDRVVIFDNGTVVRGLQALKIFPLRAGETTVGTLVCGARKPDALPESAQRELSMLALQAAEALVRTRLYEQMERLATTDGLTGLLNRRTFNAQLTARLREAQRYRRPLSLLLLDVDHFKKVNDTYGHPAGDAVLRGVAQLAQQQARETDLVARYGGEEMALVLPETDARGALVIAERIRATVAAAQHPTEQGALKVTLSVGVATWPGAGEDAAGLIESADRALYRAKQGGRNRVEAARGRAAA